MKEEKYNKKIIISIILNSIVVILTSISVINGILYGAVGAQPGTNIKGLGYFIPFTMDSNILALFSSFFIIIFNIKSIIKKSYIPPKWVIILHLMNTTSLTLTFLVTLLFLTPVQIIGGNSFLLCMKKNYYYSIL